MTEPMASAANPATPRRVGLGLTAVLLALLAFDVGPWEGLRTALFDAYQGWSPRERESAPAVVVAIDEASLAEYGQWPWPRTRMAELIERISALNPSSIALDVIMPEPDRLSPQRIVEAVPDLDEILAARISSLSSNDMKLAAAMRGRPVVLGIAGESSSRAAVTPRPLRVAPVRWHGSGGTADAAAAKLEHFDSAVRSVPEIESAAVGLGLLNNPDPAAPIVRRPMLLGQVGATPVPSLAVEALRVAADAPAIDAYLAGGDLVAVGIGDVRVPTGADGRTWMRYGTFEPGRYLPAKDILSGQPDAEEVAGKVVLLAVTGVGLLDQQTTPLGQKVSGIEVHLQLVENIFDGSWLVRPWWAPAVESLALLVLALLLVGLTTSRLHRWALPAYAALGGLMLVGGLAAFDTGLLLDFASPGLAGAVVLAGLLVSSLAETRRQRRELAQRLQAQREEAARLAGELDAARRVQMGMLPDSPDVRAGETRLEIKAFMEPAKDVGGDLYDFFMLDENTLFVLIGDVSGKGLPAAIFMALVKSLCKSAAMRRGSLAKAMADAEAEIIRENPELMFVTLTALTLDLNTGQVEYCNAGHEPPFATVPGREGHVRLAEGGGPPLCVLPGFEYQAGRYRLVPRETLCLVTDGVMDATNPNGEMYGRERLEHALEGIASEDPATVAGTLKQVLSMFSAGTELADDQTVVVLRWNGPGTSGLIVPAAGS